MKNQYRDSHGAGSKSLYIVGATLLAAHVALGTDIGTAFTFQGNLESPPGTPVTGVNCEFQFGLWGSLAGVDQIGLTQTVSAVPVNKGVFLVGPPDIDFGGGAFNGTARWLEIAVRCPTGVGSYDLLSPRVELTPVPYALALPGLYTQQTAFSPNIIGGFSGNTVTGGAYGATIGGGGESGFTNRVTTSFGTVSGGQSNTSGFSSTVGGGQSNTASGGNATVGGGSANTASAERSTVGGGEGNTASGERATVGGGQLNMASLDYSFVGGGYFNQANGLYSTVSGGRANTASAEAATVSGGGWPFGGNTASADFSTVGGGAANESTGYAATIPGGFGNEAAGMYSFAAGWGAEALHSGALVWADARGFIFASTADNQFNVRSTGGARFVTEVDIITGAPTAGVTLAGGGGSWVAISDRNLKTNFASIDPREILAHVAAMPIETWTLKSQNDSFRHIGPTAQDFRAAFGLGDSPTGINTVDADGVALAAIQGLYQIVQDKNCEVEELRSEIEDLKELVKALAAQNGGAR